MNYVRLLLFLSMLLCTSSRGAEVSPPDKAPRDSLVRVKLKDTEKATVLNRDFLAVDTTDTPYGIAFTGAPNRYVIIVVTDRGIQTIPYAIYDAGPIPPDPGPGPEPGPEPGPTPPGPPFPSEGFAVCIVCEVQEIGRLPAAQAACLTSPVVINYLRTKCIAARIWDDDYTDAHLKNAPASMKSAYRVALTAANGKLPWIVISTGKTGFSGPLPGTVDELMTLLRKYGG